MNVILNAVSFKIAWMSAVIGAANGLPLLGPAVILAAVLLHLSKADDPALELVLVAMAGVIGLAWDSVMVTAGWLTYQNGTFAAGLAPYWILAMWMLFATTLNVSLRGLRDRPLLAALLGAVFGPLSYLAGSAAGVVDIVREDAALPALALGWALLMPGLLVLAGQLDGMRPATVPAEHGRQGPG
jgi:hypothetical protein